ncbi:MAG TPA: hypothetical protein VF456_02635 [Vicinamibacterales bacterium]
MKVRKFVAPISIATMLTVGLAQAGFAGQAQTAPGTATGITDRINPSQHHLEIIALTVPPGVPLGGNIDVQVTAADKDGVYYVEVRHGEETRRFFAGGNRVVTFNATFERASLGPQTIQATAFDRNHNAGFTVDQQVIVMNPNSSHSFDDLPMAEADPGYALKVSGGVSRDQLKPPAGTPWWKWYAANFAKPYPWASLCPGVVGVTINGEVLHCWLNNNPQVRAHIIWEMMQFTGGQDEYGTAMAVGVPVPYDQWAWPFQHDLDVAFYYAYDYLKNGATNFGGLALPNVPPNQMTLADGDLTHTHISSADAWRVYVGTIAHSLALEIGGFLPWSVVSYKPNDLDLIFNDHYVFPIRYVTTGGPVSPPGSFVGYVPYGDEAIAAPAVLEFEYLVGYDMVRGNHKATIGQILEWTRVNWIHLGGIPPQLDALDTLMHEVVWGYRGDPNVAAMMQPKLLHDPITNQDLFSGQTISITRGCWGASQFLQAVLRTVNIPVDSVPDEPWNPAGGHRTAEFHTIDMALPDGDETWGMRNVDAIPNWAATEILITQQTREAWFNDPSLPIFYSGKRQEADIALKYLATKLILKYCADKTMNLPHAGSSLAKFFEVEVGGPPYYTVQDLEAMDLWTKLGVKAAQLNFCK